MKQPRLPFLPRLGVAVRRSRNPRYEARSKRRFVESCGGLLFPPRRAQLQPIKNNPPPHIICALFPRARVMRVIIYCLMRIFLKKLSVFPLFLCYHPLVESDFKHQSSRAWVGVASEQRETRSPLESTVQLKTPRGITVEEAAQLLRYSTSTVRRLIAAHILVAWKPGGPAGRKYLIDEISLARWQDASIARARTEAAPVQAALLQGELPLW